MSAPENDNITRSCCRVAPPAGTRMQANYGRWVRAATIGFGFILSTRGLASPAPTLLFQFAQQCLWAQQNGRKPECEFVGRDTHGAYAYVIKRDVVGDWQFLLIPTARVTGIESPDLIKDDAPNYFAFAWEATVTISQYRGISVPREDLALAVNSAAGRSMHQLHIHIDCIRADVREALRTHANEITNRWLSITDARWPEAATAFGGHRYFVRWVDGPGLQGVNLFRLVADRDEETNGNMALQTIVVVGGPERGRLPGFYVLTDEAHVSWGKADPIANDPGSGEDLMDHQGCPALKINR